MAKILLYIVLFFCFSFYSQKGKPTIYLVGDSTVKNGSGDGSDGLWGWGDFLYAHLDTTRINIENRARGGRSSRTYIAEGLWQDVMDDLKPGDLVIIQFGHNDGGPINDNHRARGTIKGNGDETEAIDNILTGKHEIVHSYGWYIRQYIRDARSKGAEPIVCSLVARNIWEGDRVLRATDSYTLWARQAADMEAAHFIDLNDLVATKYETLGQQYVTESLFLEDHTHTNKPGAEITARIVADALLKIKKLPVKE